MYAYCVDELHLSEDAAYKRIQAARAARRFPRIFAAVADGRLHLTAVGLLAPYLTAEDADSLLEAAAHKTKSAIDELIAQRFPRTETLPMVQALPAAPGRQEGQLAPAQVGEVAHDGGFTAQLAPAQVEEPGSLSKAKPISPGRYFVPLTVGQRMYDKLRYAQELLSHQVPSGDFAEVLERALDELIPKLEQSKFAATTQPRPRRCRPSTNPRHIPAHVKRAVWERDHGQCTFVGETGQRCPARTLIEFDHIDPVARGGQATVEGLRLRCRGHHQYEAERTFGAGFMSEKREEARLAAAARGPVRGLRRRKVSRRLRRGRESALRPRSMPGT